MRVAGLSWVPITPFAMKDWERWEDGEPEAPPRLAGWSSRDGSLREFAFDPARRAPTIAGALAVARRAHAGRARRSSCCTRRRATRAATSWPAAATWARARSARFVETAPAAARAERSHPRIASRIGRVAGHARPHHRGEPRTVRQPEAVRRLVRPGAHRRSRSATPCTPDRRARRARDARRRRNLLSSAAHPRGGPDRPPALPSTTRGLHAIPHPTPARRAARPARRDAGARRAVEGVERRPARRRAPRASRCSSTSTRTGAAGASAWTATSTPAPT